MKKINKKIPKFNKTELNIFWSLINKTEYCWEWTGVKNDSGYGSYKGIRVHRLAYALTYGNFDTKLLVCHHCDNPSCCNPEHLFLGTAYDNYLDMITKGRNIYPSKRKPKQEKEKNKYKYKFNIRLVNTRKETNIPTVNAYKTSIIKSPEWMPQRRFTIKVQEWAKNYFQNVEWHTESFEGSVAIKTMEVTHYLWELIDVDNKVCILELVCFCTYYKLRIKPKLDSNSNEFTDFSLPSDFVLSLNKINNLINVYC